MFEFVIPAIIIGSTILAILGFYASRLNLSTLTFAVAHSALAGAALALILDIDMIILALVFSLITGVILGYSSSKISSETLNNIAMTLFSLYNAIAVLAIYLSNTLVLATTRLSGLLWGSILAVTLDKFIVLVVIAVLLGVYVSSFRHHLDALLFDLKLAEAEGIDVILHSMIIIILMSISIALMLKIVGGFLVFTLVYAPILAATCIASRANIQLLISAVISSISGLSGIGLSFIYDLPVGASIALAASIITVASVIIAIVRNYMLKRAIISKT